MPDQQHTLVDPPAAVHPTVTARPADTTIRLPMARDWQVTAWAYPTDPGTPVYRLFRAGVAMPTANAVNPAPMISVERAAEFVAAGTLVPCAVSALAPLLREVTRFRDVCELVEGPEECGLEECEHFGEDGERLGPCPQIRVLATGADLMRLNRVRWALGTFDASHPGDTVAVLARLREFVDEVRAALDDPDQ